MSLFSATNQERTYEQLLHNWVILKCRTYIDTVNLYFFLTTPLVSLRISPGAYNRRFTVFGGHSFSVFIVSISVPIHC